MVDSISFRVSSFILRYQQYVPYIICPRLSALSSVWRGVSCRSVVPDVEVNPKMLGRKSRAVPEGNGPIPQDAYVMSGGITREELQRVMSETMGMALEEFKEDTRRVNQRLASLEQDAREPRLAKEAGIAADKKTRERTEGATAAVQAKCGISCPAKRIQTGPKSLTSFDMKAEPPAFPHRNDVMVDIGAAAPKLCLSPMEMRMLTAASGLLPT